MPTGRRMSDQDRRTFFNDLADRSRPSEQGGVSSPHNQALLKRLGANRGTSKPSSNVTVAGKQPQADIDPRLKTRGTLMAEARARDQADRHFELEQRNAKAVQQAQRRGRAVNQDLAHPRHPKGTSGGRGGEFRKK